MLLSKNSVIFIASRHFAIYSSRQLLISHFQKMGWQVYAIGSEDHTSGKLRDLQVNVLSFSLNRNGYSIVSDIRYISFLKHHFQQIRPSIIHCFHAKPIIFSSLASWLSSVNSITLFATITGLGRAFVDDPIKARIAGIGYKLALDRFAGVIFQNNDDKVLFEERRLLDEKRSFLIRSSGVDLTRFSNISRIDFPNKTIVFVSRLIKQKGVAHFIEIARRLKPKYPLVKFVLGGELDKTDVDCVDPKVIEDAVMDQIIYYISYVEDMAKLLQETDVYLFPSMYREGVPRTVLEAAASGVATVAYDMPGTRDVVIDHSTGLLAKSGDISSLRKLTEALINNDELRNTLGNNAREYVTAHFGIESVLNQYVSLYESLYET